MERPDTCVLNIPDFVNRIYGLTFSILFSNNSSIVDEIASDIATIEKLNDWEIISLSQFDVNKILGSEVQFGVKTNTKVLTYFQSKANPVIITTSTIVDGWYSLSFRASIRNKCPYLVLSFSGDTEAARRSFEFGVAGTLIRSVSVMREDNKWKFYQYGEPQKFENINLLSERRIQDRVTIESLLEICKHLGICIERSVCADVARLIEVKPR